MPAIGRVLEWILHTYWPYILAILLAVLALAFALQSLAAFFLPRKPSVEIRYVTVPSPPEIRPVGVLLPCEECSRKKRFAPLDQLAALAFKPQSTDSRAPYSATSAYRRGHAANGGDG
jgi:hypothetical protein